MTRLVKDKQVVETTNNREVYRLKASGFVVVEPKPRRSRAPKPDEAAAKPKKK